MTRVRATCAVLVAAAVSASATSPILLQTDGLVSKAVANQLAMVENFVNKFLKEKAPITQEETEAFAAVYDMFDKVTLPNINNGDSADRQTLDDRVQSIKDCDKDVVSVKQALEEMTKEIDDCRAEEARLKGVREAALKALDDHRASLVSAKDVSLSLLQAGSGAQARAPGCATPPVAEWEQFGTFFSRTSGWYSENAQKLHTLADAWRAAVSAHEAQIKKCDALQQDFEAKFCMWHHAVSKVTDEYAQCREVTIKALDDTYPIVVESTKHRKADFTAVQHVQCLLKVLESADADKEQGLRDCIATKVDTNQLTIEKPDVPPAADEDLEQMINDIAHRHTGITASEEKVLDEAEEMCKKDSEEVMQAKHDADVQQIADELAAINQCDTVRETMSAEVAKKNGVLAAARSDLQQNRAEEARLKGIMEAASQALESFIVTSDSSRPACPMPAATEKDAIGKYFDDREAFYTSSNQQYKDLRADLKAKTEAYNAQVVISAGKQAVFDAALCDWSAAVTSTRTTYKTCRDNTVPTLEATEEAIHAKEAKRTTDWTAVKREQCFLEEIKTNSGDHNQCSDQAIDVNHLAVTYPEMPASADDALVALGDLSAESPSVPCPSA